MGMLYQRGKKGIWWIKFYRAGKPYRRTSRSTRKGDARRLLAQMEGKIAVGEFNPVRADKVFFEDLAKDFLNDYRANGRRTLRQAGYKVKILAGFFGGKRAQEIMTADIQKYTVQRQEAGAANATINRELAALKHMFILGIKGERIHRRPHIPMLQEDNVRTGFFGEVEFLALQEAMPAYLRPAIAFAYMTGWRRGEVFGLQWGQVDLQAGTVRLEPGVAKNREGRTVVLTEGLRKILGEQWQKARAVAHQERKVNPTPREIAAAVPWVFHHRGGQRISDFRKAWEAACEQAKVPGRLFHDLRRTAVRNMVRAGIPERVAMMISGHKTRSVFDRYNIVAEGDLREAARKMEGFLGGVALVTELCTVSTEFHQIPPHPTKGE